MKKNKKRVWSTGPIPDPEPVKISVLSMEYETRATRVLPSKHGSSNIDLSKLAKSLDQQLRKMSDREFDKLFGDLLEPNNIDSDNRGTTEPLVRVPAKR